MTLNITVMNFFLFIKWCPTHGQGLLRYADITAVAPPLINNTNQMPSVQEIQIFQRRHFISSQEGTPVAQVAFILVGPNSYYRVAIFDYRTQSAYLLGRHYQATSRAGPQQSWKDWHGPSYWMCIAMLHGWPYGDIATVQVQEYSWFPDQLSTFDCGPFACFILAHLLETGLIYNQDGSLHRPNIPCGHAIRLEMFELVKLSCRKAGHHYLYLQGQPQALMDWDPTDHVSSETIENIWENPTLSRTHQTIITQLATMLYNCPSCKSSKVPGQKQRGAEEEILTLDSNPEDDHPINNRVQRDQILQQLPMLPESHSLTDTQLHHPSKWLPFDGRFDNYYGGPTLESMHPIMDAGQIWSSSSNTWISGLGSTSLFRDYGYRILPSFHQMFWLGPPMNTLDHILKIGVSDTYDPTMQLGYWRTQRNSLSRSTMFLDTVIPSDARIMSPTEMLQDVQQHQSEKTGVYETLFVYGADLFQPEKRIVLDLELDGCHPKKITISVDIDSYIWVTNDFHSAGSIGIYLAPVIDKQAPIHKHNHIYVDILMPQGAEDQGLDGTQRTEWWTKSVPLSSIPHVPFGMLSTGNHTSNLYICFPRMIHNHVNSSRRVTRVPLDVIDLFWNQVVLPSISQEASNSSRPYMETTVDEMRYKQRKGLHSQPGNQRPKAIPLSQTAFKQLQKNMRSKVNSGEMLASYGSFFFVLEGKGIKLWTKDGQDNLHASPYEALKENFSNLDWEYMMDQTHGALYLDVGVSFNPIDNCVGLWRLDALKASFQAGGFRTGTTHHTSTLGRYGGIQAEMLLKHSRPSQICFRSAYQLCYEAIRPNNNAPNFISDQEAYKVTEQYLKECRWTHDIYATHPPKRAYGCRDEYRMSGQAALEVLPRLKEKVSIFSIWPRGSKSLLMDNGQAEAFLQSRPILWIPSQIWFDLMASRIEGLKRAQKALKKENPPNYGTKTSILCHLIRCLYSTPIVMDPYLRQSLKDLEAERFCDRFGMLFLYDMDEQIVKEDSSEVRKIMGANVKVRRKVLAPSNPFTSSEDWPLGPTPSWKDVSRLIEDQPERLIRPWVYDPIWDLGDLNAGLFFVQFTREFWLQLSQAQTTNAFADTMVINPRICDNLKEAMACWSLDHVNTWILSVKFQASSAGLEGDIPGRHHLSFAQRRTTFFPAQNTIPGLPISSKWRIYWTDGYIARYHQLCLQLSTAQLQHFHDKLDMLFANIQCLPDVNKPTSKTPGSTWTLAHDCNSIKMVTNPHFYRLQKIGIQTRAAKRPTTTKRPQDFHVQVLQMQGLDPKRNRASKHLRKPQVDRRSTRTKQARKPPTRPIKV